MGEPAKTLQFVEFDLSAADGSGVAIEASTRNPYLPVGEPDVEPGQVQVNLGPCMVYLRSSTVSDEELVRIARSISVAGDWNDPTTWIEAARAPDRLRGPHPAAIRLRGCGT